MRKIADKLKLYWKTLNKKTIGILALFLTGINAATSIPLTIYLNDIYDNLEDTTIEEPVQEGDTTPENVYVDTIGTDPFIEVGLISNNQDRNESYYAITSKGYLYTWGWNLNGELGLGIEDSYVFYPTFVNLDGSFNDINNNGIKDNGEMDTITDGDKVKQVCHINWDQVSDAGIFVISQEDYLYMWGSSKILPEKNTDEYKYSSSKSSKHLENYVSPVFVNLDKSYLEDNLGNNIQEPAHDINGLLYKDSSNNNVNVNIPTKTEGDKVSDVEIYATSKDSYGGMVLSKKGELYGWGKNYSNIIDQNISTSKSKTYDELTKVIYETGDPYKGTTYKEMSVTNNSSTNTVTALGDDGFLYMWGETTLIPNISHSSQSTTSRVKIDLTDSNVSSDITNSGKVKDFNMSRIYSTLLLINEDGYLYTIGNNSGNSAAGNGCKPPSSEDLKFVSIDINCDGKLNDRDKVNYISATDNMASAITEDGYLYSWGNDTGESIGNGHSRSENKPYQLDINQDLIYDSNDKVIATDNSNPNHNGAITNSGDLYMWGLNDPSSGNGVLPETKDGSFSTRNNISPVKVNLIEYEEGEKFTNLEFWHLGGVTSTDFLNIYTWGSYNFSEDRTDDNLRNVDKFTVDKFVTPAIALK